MTFDTLRRGGMFAAILLAAGLTAGVASADVSGFLGNWVNSDSGASSFLGGWTGSDRDASGIARIEVTPAGATHVRIHLFGRCETGVCDWGTQVAHNHSTDPGSDDVRSISADFNTGFAQKRITLRPGPGGGLRFDVATEFTDNSGRHDYETSGSLALAATANPPPAATASGNGEPVAAAPGAPAVGAPAVGAAASSEPLAQSGGLTEDCAVINPEDLFVAPSDRGYKVSDYNHTILDFGANKLAAVKAERVLRYYHIDEQCFVVRPHPKMYYWRVTGQVPRAAMPGEDCTAVNPAKVRAAQTGNTWKVLNGDNALLDYGDDRAAAEQAVSVIRTYRLSRQCFVARPDATMQYWLTQ